MRLYIVAALSLAVSGGQVWGQPQNNISQKTGGECSPAVITQGNVTITCTGLDPRQQEMLRKMPGLIDQLLKKSQFDRDAILVKLEEILKHQREAETRNADRYLTAQQMTDLAKFFAPHPKGRFRITANVTAKDARKYADEIAAFFTGKLGWNVRVVAAIITGPNPVGMWITVRNPKSPPNGAGLLQHGLKSAGILVRGEYNPDGPDADEFWLTIGAKP